MISNCLNPDCGTPFSHASDGRFFSVEVLTANGSSGRVVEQYLLCESCSRAVKVVIENGAIATVPIDSECKSLAG